MTSPTFPPPPDYSSFSTPQLQAAQASFNSYLSSATYKPALLNLHPRLDSSCYANWLQALNSELASRP